MVDLERNLKNKSSDSPSEGQGKSALRKIFFTLGLVCICLVFFAPQIASFTFVPGLLHSAIDRSVTGDIQVSGVRLSWFGSQRVDEIRIDSVDDDTSLQAGLGIDRSLFDLIFDSSNLGVIRVNVSGYAEVREDGTVTFRDLLNTSVSTEVNPLSEDAVNLDPPLSSHDESNVPNSPQFLPMGIDVEMQLNIAQLTLRMPEGNPAIEINNARLEGSIASTGRVVADMANMPSSILELYGDSSRLAVAALGESVSGDIVLDQDATGDLAIKLNIESPYAEVSMPMATLSEEGFSIPETEPARADVRISTTLSSEILSVLHPLFASIQTTEKPIQCVIGPVATQHNSGLENVMAIGELDVGEVVLSSTALGSQILSMIEGRAAERLGARFGSLEITMIDGRIRYNDFVVEIGRRDDGSYVQSLLFSGDIDLVSNPPRVLAISAAYPGSNLASFFSDLRTIPPVLLDTLRPTVTMYGPLFDVDGDRIPLKSRVEPFDLESTLLPDNLRGILKGVGELLQR